jgi:hypothetical protein
MSDENGAARSAQHRSPGEGRAAWFLTDLYIIKAVSEDTDGVFTLSYGFEVPTPPPTARA